MIYNILRLKVNKMAILSGGGNMEKLNNIKINNTEDRFEVEIPDLDLSFLEEGYSYD